jgi:hypothetical protein
VLGRYGTGEEFHSAVDIIARLGFRDAGAGWTALVNLRTYPAVLLLVQRQLTWPVDDN